MRSHNIYTDIIKLSKNLVIPSIEPSHYTFPQTQIKGPKKCTQKKKEKNSIP